MGASPQKGNRAMKPFAKDPVTGGWAAVPADYTLEYRPLWYHNAGLQQTASGYGSALVSSQVAKLADGRVRRVYVTIYSNIGTAWILLDGLRYVVR
jgi:hypothetical protein